MSEKCVLCGGDEAEAIFSGPDRVLGTPGTYSVVRCKSCGLARTEPQIPVEDRAKYYAPEEDAAPGRDVRIQLYQSRLAGRVDRAVTGGNRKVLDIGCGEGVFLELMRSRDWETMGVELGEESSRIAREERGLDVVTGDLFSQELEAESFDAVVMSHVLEHLSEPVAALERIQSLLKPGGMLMLSLPNHRCLEAKIFRENWFCWVLPPHLYHFNPRAAGMALGKAGLVVEKITYLPFFFLVQSIRNVRTKSRVGPVVDGPKPESAGAGDRVKTVIFRAILRASSLAGRVMPGEIMEIEARKPAR